jgi:hypothetical protein
MKCGDRSFERVTLFGLLVAVAQSTRERWRMPMRVWSAEVASESACPLPVKPLCFGRRCGRPAAVHSGTATASGSNPANVKFRAELDRSYADDSFPRFRGGVRSFVSTGVGNGAPEGIEPVASAFGGQRSMNGIRGVRESVRSRQKRLAFPSSESMCMDVRGRETRCPPI